MNDRNAWGHYVDKEEAGTMRAAEIEQREAMRRQQEEQDRLALEHQRRMEMELERQQRRDRQIQSKRRKAPKSRTKNTPSTRSQSKANENITSSIGKLSTFLAIASGLYAFSQPQFQADALGIALFVLVASFIGFYILYYALKTAFFLVKWALVGVGTVFIFYVIAAALGNS
jgi:cation transport ATPase